MKQEKSSQVLEELAINVLKNYRISPDSVRIIQNNGLKTLWKVSHQNETKCLKRLKHAKEKATFTVFAQKHIFDQGGNVPEIYLNDHGSPITEHSEQLFVLYEWIEGRDLSFKIPQDLALALQGLAKFHHFSKNYQPPTEAKISSKLGRWSEQYASMKKRMLKWKAVALEKSRFLAYKSYLEYIDSIIEIADQALAALEKSSYQRLTDIDLQQTTLCHQDFGEGNVIYAEPKVYVIDFDGVTYDLVIRDLRKIIGKRMEKRGKWDIAQIRKILNYYEKYYQLSVEEQELLRIDLMFPHWFFGKVKNLFKKNKPLKASEINKIGALEEKKLLVLEDWF